MSEKTFNQTLIIGLGLIGGSFAKSLRQNKVSNKIYAYDSNPDSLEQAIKSGAIDDFVMLDEKLSSFDLIVLATPLSTYNQIIKQIAPQISADATLIDLGSVKELEIKTKILPPNLRQNFIPCHPIAGSEKNGFENSSANLFQNKKFIICPENTNPVALKKVENLAKEIGGIVDFLKAKEHDEIYALVSHLPQFLSFLTKDLSPKKLEDEFFKNAFRLDNSDAEIWSDIFKLNEKNLEKFYLEFFDILEKNFKSLGKSPTQQGSQQLDGVAFNENFFEQNFTAIFFRAILVASYLELPKIKTFQSYAGSGFKDFTSIASILNYDAQKLTKLIEKNRSQILKLFNSLS